MRVDLRSRARLLSVAVDMVKTFKTVQQGKCKTKDAAAALSKHMDKFMLVREGHEAGREGQGRDAGGE